ncbi:MAG: DUF1080 domain-containing protein [Clostridia bacterium]|nr:DUF1080 domain-containing protein [Clostridia bacterium]
MSAKRLKVSLPRKAAIVALAVLVALATAFGLIFLSSPQKVGADGVSLDVWESYHGSTSTEYKDGALKMNSATNPGTVFFTEKTFVNYEAEVEMQLDSGSWFGIMYRGANEQKGFYQLGTGANGYHQLKRHVTKSSGSGWDEVNIIRAAEGFSAYALGKAVTIKWRVENDKITLMTKPEGEDGYFTEFDNVDLPQELCGTDGYIGFCMQYSAVTVYSVSITDLDSDYVYASDFGALSEPVPEWSVIRGVVTPSYSDGVYKLAPTANPTVYGINNVAFKNYVLEAEIEFDKNWAGVCFRVNGAHKGFFSINTSKSYVTYHETKSGDGWASASVESQNTEYTKYTYGSRISLRVEVSGNMLTAKTKVIGTDDDYCDIFSELDISSIYDGKLGTRGGVGLISRTGTTLKVYDFVLADTDSGKTYYLPNTVGTNKGEWAVTRGTATPENITDGDETYLQIAPTANPTSYVLTGVNFRNYVLETEFSFNANWGGVVFRANNTYKGLYSVGTTNRSLNQHQTASGSTWSDDKLSNRKNADLTYTLSTRIKVRMTVNNDLLTIQSIRVGTDDEWQTDFADYDITTIPNKAGTAGVLGNCGEVGFITRTGTTMYVYSFDITDTDTGYHYDYFAGETENKTDDIAESVVFDGNHAIDTDKTLSKTPDTTEIWFKTEGGARQTLLTDYKYDTYRNGFTLDMLASGALYYTETNGGGYSDINLYTSNSYADGKWHKAVIRRYYDEDKGLLKGELVVVTDNVIVEKVAATLPINADKKSLYEANGNVFIAERYLQIGVYMQARQLYTGEIGEIRMWDRVLTDEEMTAFRAALNGDEEDLLHDFVPDTDNNFVDKVTFGTQDEVKAETYEVWLENCVLSEADFRIAVLPDVQFLNEGFEISLRNYFKWIRDNAEELNIKLVISVGDLVNTCTPEQMYIVTEAASILDGVVPFMPVMGNHDYPSYGRDEALFNQYYRYDVYSQYDYFGGAYEEGSMENYYYLMTINGADYLFMGLELAVRPAVAEWANQVIAAYPERKVIIVNHAFMDNNFGDLMDSSANGAPSQYKTDAGMDADELWDIVISKHDNIILVLCGHMNTHQVLHREFTNENGHVVNALEFDFSHPERHFGGAGLLGILGFTDGDNTVKVNAYSTVKDKFFIEGNQFEAELDWREEYRVTFADGLGNVLFDDCLEAGAPIVAPAAPANYSDGVYDYAFIGYEGYAEDLVADKNYSFTAAYEKTASSIGTVNEELAASISAAKAELFAGNAGAYVRLIENANGVTAILTDRQYLIGDTLTVFGQDKDVAYVDNGALYVHILAFGTATGVTVLSEGGKLVIAAEAFKEGKTEINVPTDLNRTHYDYMTGKYHVTVYDDDEIALTTSADRGENVVVFIDGEYILVEVGTALWRNVAKAPIIGENSRKTIKLIDGDGISAVDTVITMLMPSNIDGDLSDWNEDIIATGRTMVGIDDTSDKSVTYYAYLTGEGLYVAAVAHHALFINNVSEWYNNTNLEFCIAGRNAAGELNMQFWITANPNFAHHDVTGVIKTVASDNGYISVAEGFVPMRYLPVNALTGELKIGLAWKTPGDNIKYYNIPDGYDWWYPTRRHAHEDPELYFVNSAGLWLFTSVKTTNGIKLDGDFTDFNADALTNNLTLYSTDGAVGYDLYAQYLTGSGVYVGITAKHRTNPWPFDNYSWYNNTNFEFYVGENRYYVTICGAASGKGLYGQNVYLSQSFDEETSLYTTTIELFIPDSAIGLINNKEYVRMGFAFKPTGELAAFDGFDAARDFWYVAGHSPSDTAAQFYVYEYGIFSGEAEAVNEPAKCTDMLISRLISAKTGEEFLFERVPDNMKNLHSYSGTEIAVPATCTEEGLGYHVCEYCGDKKPFVIEPTGHDWGEPEWSWSDDHAASATFTCANDGEHTLTFEAEVSSIIAPASCEEDGSVIYTATITFGDKAYTDQKTATLPALGHNYSAAFSWAETEDGYTAAATMTCLNEPEYSETTEAVVTVDILTDKKVYTATVTFDGKVYTDEKIVLLTVGDERNYTVTFSWGKSKDGYTAAATVTCDEDPEYSETIVATVTVETGEKDTVYTAIVTFGGKEYTEQKTVKKSKAMSCRSNVAVPTALVSIMIIVAAAFLLKKRKEEKL